MEGETPMVLELNHSIDKWLAAKDRRNIAVLANVSNVPYSTLRRIRTNEAKASAPTALAISEVVMKTGERVQFFKEHFPVIGKIMASAYPPNKRLDAISEKVKKYFTREPHNRIFNMAATVSGVTKKEIRHLLGEVGVEALQDLLADEILFDTKGRIKFKSDHWTLSNVDDILNQIKCSVSYFDKSLIGTDYASLINTTGTIKASHLPKVKKLVEKFASELAAIKNDPTADGPVCFFCNVSYSLFDKQQLNLEQ